MKLFVIHISILDLNDLLDSMISRCTESQPAKYICQTCGKTMAQRAFMRRHVEVHLDMSHPCIVCDKSFKTRNALSTHYTRHHGSEVISPWTTK